MEPCRKVEVTGKKEKRNTTKWDLSHQQRGAFAASMGGGVWLKGTDPKKQSLGRRLGGRNKSVPLA